MLACQLESVLTRQLVTAYFRWCSKEINGKLGNTLSSWADDTNSLQIAVSDQGNVGHWPTTSDLQISSDKGRAECGRGFRAMFIALRSQHLSRPATLFREGRMAGFLMDAAHGLDN